MAFVAVPNTVLVEMIHFNSTTVQYAENTLYFENSGGWDATSAGDLADALSDWWESTLGEQASPTWELSTIRVTDLSSATGFVVEHFPGLTATGASAALPGNVTVAISFRTESRGRSYRGRNYFIGLGEGSVTNDTVNSGIVTALVDAYEALAASVAALGAVHVVVSRVSGGVERETGVTTPVTAYRVDSTVDSQRRRLAGRGR